jgi:hypothetical protein
MRRLALAATLLALGGAGCGGGDDEDQPKSRPPREVAAEATRQDSCPGWPRFRPYWAGERAGGLPLTSAEWYCTGGLGGVAFVSYGYGDCDPPEGEGGCALPLEVQSSPLCLDPPATLAGELPVRLELRGVPAR